MPKKWYIIDNTSQTVEQFTSLRKLKRFAKEKGWDIQKSPTDERGYYTSAFRYLPNGGKTDG